MKRLLSLALSAAMVLSSVPFAYANEDWKQGTKVEYVAQNNENWTITVPAKLQPGTSGTVTLDGYWPSNKTITVDADDTVVLKNSILQSDTKTLNITFPGITKLGNNTERSTASETVSVQAIDNALFGTWNGSFYYNVETSETINAGCDTLYWDGTTEGVYCETSEFLTGLLPDCACYQIWNQPVDLDQFSEIEISYIYQGTLMTETRYLDDIINEEIVDGFYVMDGGLIIIPTNITDPETGESIYAGEPGIYFAIQEWGRTVSLTIPGYTGFEHFDGCPHDNDNNSTMPSVTTYAEGDYTYNIETYGCSFGASTLEEAWKKVHELLAAEGMTWEDMVTILYEEEGITEAELKAELGLTEETFEPSTYGWAVSINEDVTDKTKTCYGPILESIEGYPITNLDETFRECVNLTESPVIPATVTSMRGTFSGCTNLQTAPVLPNSVVDMGYTFDGCASLIKAPKLPDNVVDLNWTFENCSSLIEAPIIPDTVEKMNFTFDETSIKTYAGSTDPDGDFSNYVIPSKVTTMEQTFLHCTYITHAPDVSAAISLTNMTNTFSGCTSLIEAPILPDNVENMAQTFNDCTNLKTYAGSTAADGDFTDYVIPNSVRDMTYTFGNCKALIKAPQIPFGVEILSSTFCGCANLIQVYEIPESVTDLGYAFMWCYKLQAAPAVPSNVQDMEQTFYSCTSLTGSIEINANPSVYSKCFSGTDMSKITLTGDSTMLDILGATGNNYCAECNGMCLNNH